MGGRFLRPICLWDLVKNIEIIVNLRERMSLCTVLEAMWWIENKKWAVLKPKQNSKNIWRNLKNHFLIQILEQKFDFGLEINMVRKIKL
jgi:hypothetical protein